MITWGSEQVASSYEIIKHIGGKALGLHELKRLGITVPAWVTLSTSIFRNICQADTRLLECLQLKNSEPLEKAIQIQACLKHIKLEPACQRLLSDVWDKISEGGRKPVAVRSSAVCEDSEALSFAGQMDSFLNIRNFQACLNAIRNCWASAFGERVVLYSMQHGIDPWGIEIAVILQQMIEAQVSGVIFTANPLTGNTDEILISSIWGIGEGLVSGVLDADIFTIDLYGEVIKSEIADKKHRISYNVTGGTSLAEVESGQQSIPSLNPHQLKALHSIAHNVQHFKGIPMDIEFAMEDNKIYFLQARPITNLKTSNRKTMCLKTTEPKTANLGSANLKTASLKSTNPKIDHGKYHFKDNFNVWDNSNIVESYSGVTSPMTFSFIRKAYYAVYCQFCETIGVHRKTIFKNRHTFENMLGLIEGRVYYNLLNWYRLLSLMPGFKYNKSFMEQMMGIHAEQEFDAGQASSGWFEKYFIQLPHLLKVAFKMLLAHLQLQKKIEEFYTHFRSIYIQYTQFDYSMISPSEMLDVYHVLEDEVLWKWKAPITNDFEAMIFYGLLKHLTMKWGLDPQGVLQNDLLCGEGGIKSTEVTRQLFYIAQAIEKDGNLRSAFLEASPEKALSMLKNDNSFMMVNDKFEAYLKTYGVRCINEMKLESVPIKDDPTFCIAMIQNYLINTVPDPAKQEEHERTIRQKAEAALHDKLKSQHIFFLIPKLTIYRWTLNNARRAIKNRENQRFCRTEAYSLIRTIMRAIGKQWQDKGIIGETEDIFYLEMDDVWSFIKGTSTCIDLKGLISIRKRAFEGYHQTVPDDHIETCGEVYAGNLFKTDTAGISHEMIMRGLGCCAGIVEQDVRLVLKPDSGLKLNGEIMVAKQTDPGWVVLFPSVSGLIIEKGSMLSHSAIVAREMGIPAVVGVKNATNILSTGDHVLLNGAEGTIKILKKANIQ